MALIAAWPPWENVPEPIVVPLGPAETIKLYWLMAKFADTERGWVKEIVVIVELGSATPLPFQPVK